MDHRQLTLILTLMASPGLPACVDDPGGGESTAESTAALEACSFAPVVTISPTTIPPAAPGASVVFDVAVINPNPADCAPIEYLFTPDDTGLLFEPRPLPAIVIGGGPGGGLPATSTLDSGATAHHALTATVPASADAGDTFEIVASVRQPPAPGQPNPQPALPVATAPVELTVPAQPGCQVSAARELMIRDVSVVDDPVRTVFDPASTDPRNGVWTFKHLVEQMAKTPADAPAMVEQLLTSFIAPVTINGFTVAARPGMQAKILDSWPRTASGALDLAQAPLRLQAIVSRIDLRDLKKGDAGEGRFVFAFDLPLEPGAPPPEATLIFEYKLPALIKLDVLKWANAFHALGSLPFGESYNAALQAITHRFVRRGARPGAPNGNAIAAVRTNEIPFGPAPQVWELREFHLSATTGRLEPAALELTPDLSFNNSTTLVAYINANQDKILKETHTVPATFQGQPFKAGAVLNDLLTWTAPGVDPEARHHFAINTCDGCHAAQETGAVFLHLVPRRPGEPSERSRWLTGTVIDDPVTGQPRAFDDLGRRKTDLKSLVCKSTAELAAGDVEKGISRVH